MHRQDRKRVVISTSRQSRSSGRPGRRTGSREGVVALSVIGAAALATFLALFVTSRPYDPMDSTFDAQQTVPSGPLAVQSPTPSPTPTATSTRPSEPPEPAGETAAVDDATIQTQIERASRSDPALANLDVSTIVEGGRVTIIGSVPSAETKQRVERTIRAIQGVVAVDNQLVVIEATPQ
ncbi:MAG: BON domain-containing protein [Pyrinomonadaceae bacterium]